MPYAQPQTLTSDEAYAVTAYLLRLNGIIEETAEMNADAARGDDAEPGELQDRLPALSVAPQPLRLSTTRR
jgi:hypothetical protein